MKIRTVKRKYHSWNLWECYKSGFYNSEAPEGMSTIEAEVVYLNFFKDLVLFDNIITEVFDKWKYSCEQFLTNTAINRVAWLGQACVCLYAGVPSRFKGAFYKLSKEEQILANDLAERRINIWIMKHERTDN